LGASKRELGLAQHVERIRGAALGLGDTGADRPCDCPLDDAERLVARLGRLGHRHVQARRLDGAPDALR